MSEKKIGYAAIHIRAHKTDPKPVDGICELCGKVEDKFGKSKLVHSNKDHSYRLPINPDDWQWIHHSCHVKYDIEHGIMKKPIGRKPSGIKQKIIAIVIKKELVEEVDKIREDYNLKRSKFISKILDYVCKDEKLLQEIFKEELEKITKKDGII